MSQVIQIAADDPCLEGHFPGNPIVPAVVILDSVVDVAEQHLEGSVYGIERCRFRAPLHPGAEFRVELADPDGETVRFRCVDDDVEIARGRLRVRMTQEPSHPLD
jgi:3-hydroxymyristoyl/3-hydroxydecanoyl-(acyl carrier protein) dehydratase